MYFPSASTNSGAPSLNHVVIAPSIWVCNSLVVVSRLAANTLVASLAALSKRFHPI